MHHIPSHTSDSMPQSYWAHHVTCVRSHAGELHMQLTCIQHILCAPAGMACLESHVSVTSVTCVSHKCHEHRFKDSSPAYSTSSAPPACMACLDAKSVTKKVPVSLHLQAQHPTILCQHIRHSNTIGSRRSCEPCCSTGIFQTGCFGKPRTTTAEPSAHHTHCATRSVASICMARFHAQRDHLAKTNTYKSPPEAVTAQRICVKARLASPCAVVEQLEEVSCCTQHTTPAGPSLCGIHGTAAQHRTAQQHTVSTALQHTARQGWPAQHDHDTVSMPRNSAAAHKLWYVSTASHAVFLSQARTCAGS
jgi:hypothetical protein